MLVDYKHACSSRKVILHVLDLMLQIPQEEGLVATITFAHPQLLSTVLRIVKARNADCVDRRVGPALKRGRRYVCHRRHAQWPRLLAAPQVGGLPTSTRPLARRNTAGREREPKTGWTRLSRLSERLQHHPYPFNISCVTFT